jgi:hypothetical protein
VLFLNGSEQQCAKSLSSVPASSMLQKHAAGDAVRPGPEALAARYLVAASPYDQEDFRDRISGVGRASCSAKRLPQHLSPVL